MSNVIREFGVDWQVRDDTAFSPYRPENVTRYYAASPVDNLGNKLFPTTRRIGLSAPEGTAACIMTPASLGFGTYEVYLIGRMDAFDPTVVSAVWTHHDFKPDISVEIDFEFSPWRDQNRTKDRIQLGVFVGGKRVDAFPQRVFGASSYYYHRITLQQFPTISRVKAEGWWEINQTWKEYAQAEWAVKTPEMGQFKIGIGPMSNQTKYTLPKAASLPAKIVVAGFKFTPMSTTVAPPA